jgi:hypothetical protein
MFQPLKTSIIDTFFVGLAFAIFSIPFLIQDFIYAEDLTYFFNDKVVNLFSIVIVSFLSIVIARILSRNSKNKYSLLLLVVPFYVFLSFLYTLVVYFPLFSGGELLAALLFLPILGTNLVLLLVALFFRIRLTRSTSVSATK